MPTTRPRHTITETDEVARALETAQHRWPDERSPRRLLLRLIAEGERRVQESDDRHARERAAAIRRNSGAATGMYPPGYLDDLRNDWPE
jgi:hypothetical protein